MAPLRKRPRYRKWVHPFRDHPDLAAAPFRDHPDLAAAFDRGLAAMAADFAARQRAHGLTLEQFADRAGLSRNGLRHFLNCRSDPKFSTLIRIAAVFDLEVRVVLRPRVTSSLPRDHAQDQR